jgi:hypothetical protein
MIEKYSSLQWIRRYQTYGVFELHTTPDALLDVGNLLYKDREAAIIEGVIYDIDEKGRETVVISGSFTAKYLAHRIVYGTAIFNNQKVEAAMRQIVSDYAINPSPASWAVPNLILGELRNYAPLTTHQVSYAALTDALTDMAVASGLGYRVALDSVNRKLIFEVYEGLNRAAGQTEHAQAIFAPEFENVVTQSYEENERDYYNIAVVAGRGEGADRRIVSAGDTGAAGLDARVVYVDARDIGMGENGEILPEAEQDALLTARGMEKLAKLSRIACFECKINPESNLQYKTDYDLGDIVTCKSKRWGKRVDARITEINEIYEPSGVRLSVTFGDPVSTILTQLKGLA